MRFLAVLGFLCTNASLPPPHLRCVVCFVYSITKLLLEATRKSREVVVSLKACLRMALLAYSLHCWAEELLVLSMHGEAHCCRTIGWSCTQIGHWKPRWAGCLPDNSDACIVQWGIVVLETVAGKQGQSFGCQYRHALHVPWPRNVASVA